MIGLIYAIIIMLSAYALGRTLLCRVARLSFASVLEEFVFSCSIGFGVLAYGVLLLGLLGWLKPIFLYGLLLGILLMCHRQLLTGAKSLLKALRNGESLHAFEKRLLLLLAALFLVQLILASAPVTQHDALYYHLLMPKIYLQHHAIVPIPQNFASEWPFTVEMVYMLGMGLYNDSVVQFIPVLFSLVLLAGIALYAQKYFSRRVGLLGALLFYTLPPISQYVPVPFVEVFLVLFTLLGVYAFLQWYDTSRLSWMALSGLSVGFAAGCKLTGFSAGLAIGLYLIGIILRRRRSLTQSLLAGVLLTLLTFTVASPWYVKSYIRRGHPLYPWSVTEDSRRTYIKELVTIGQGVDTLVDDSRFQPVWEQFKKAGKRIVDHPASGIAISLFMLPLRMTFSPGIYDQGTPLFLSFLPFLLVLRGPSRTQKFIGQLLIFILLFLVILHPTVSFLRKLSIVFPYLCVLTAYIIVRLLEKGRIYKKLTLAIVGCALVFNTLFLLAFGVYVSRGVFGLDSREEYLTRRTRFYETFTFINHHLPENAKIGIPWLEAYYLDRDYIPYWRGAFQFDHFYSADLKIPFGKAATYTQFLRKLCSLGVTHLLVPGDEATLTSMKVGFPWLDAIEQQATLQKVFQSHQGTRLFEIIVPEDYHIL